MSRRCLICTCLNPCPIHSEADQQSELARNDRAIAKIKEIHPMKVSEAVERLRVYVDESDGFVSVPNADLVALLASHEALRLAGEKVVKTWRPGKVRLMIEDLRALDLAVEDASK